MFQLASTVVFALLAPAIAQTCDPQKESCDVAAATMNSESADDMTEEMRISLLQRKAIEPHDHAASEVSELEKRKEELLLELEKVDSEIQSMESDLGGPSTDDKHVSSPLELGQYEDSSPVCPYGFTSPGLQRYTEPDHGDVCRNSKINGMYVGWTCPGDCEAQNSAPWCKERGSWAPCRAKASELVVTNGYPGGYDVAGKYFGFANDNADSIFGPNWNGKTFAVTVGDKSGKIIVWRDNTNCLMSCGRWDPTSNAGDWSAGDTIRVLVSVCPVGFTSPGLERHTEPDHGDVCRNSKTNGINVGWTCPVGCVAQNTAPWCKASVSSGAPCRVEVE